MKDFEWFKMGSPCQVLGGSRTPVRRHAQDKDCFRMTGSPRHASRGRLAIYAGGKRRRSRITPSRMDRNLSNRFTSSAISRRALPATLAAVPSQIISGV
jgi:hypothetical protein